MRKNIWFIMGGAMLIITLVITIIQGCVLTTLMIAVIRRDVPISTPLPTETSIAAVQPPLIGEPRVHAFAPLKPGEETVISVDVSSAIGISPTYTWYADGGKIVRGQGSPAITYRAPDGSGSYGVRVVVKWDGQSVEKATSIKVVEEPTPVPMSQLPAGTSVSPTGTSGPPTGTPTATLTPRATPTARPTLPPLSPDAARQQLAPLDRKMQEFDEWVKQTEPERLEKARCPCYTSGECWVYPIGIGNVILVEECTYANSLLESDVYVYDFDGDGQSEILKWDLDRDGEFDVIEYDVDEDGMLDLARGDADADGQFDNDEIYIMQPTWPPVWQPLVPGALPFPLVPIIPY